MKSSVKILVPFTESEWHFVKANLMSDDVDILQQVFDFLCMWEWRLRNETPVFIQMTKLVIQAILYDQRHCSDNYQSNEYNSASINGLSLTRFINYVNNAAQPRVGRLVSIAAAVKTLGIPEEIVHLRQNVVHDQMPSAGELREAIRFCREWLWETSWKYSMSIAICDPSLPTAPKASKEPTGLDLRQLFDRYWRYSIKSTNDQNEKATLQRRTRAIVDVIANMMSDNLRDILNNFCNSLILSMSEMDSVEKHLQLPDFEADKRSWKISELHFKVWHPIINIFSQGRFGVLIGHLSGAVRDEIRSTDDRHQLVAWFRRIIDKIASIGTHLVVKDLNVIASNVINADKFFTVNDFNKVLILFGDAEERKRFYRRMWELKRSEPANDENNAVQLPPNILTLESLKTALDRRKGLKRRIDMPVSNADNWSLKNVDCPLGLYTDQTAETLFLKI